VPRSPWSHGGIARGEEPIMARKGSRKVKTGCLTCKCVLSPLPAPTIHAGSTLFDGLSSSAS